MSTQTLTSSALLATITTILHSADHSSNNNNNDNHNNNNNNRNSHRRPYNPDTDVPKTSALAFLSLVLSIFLLVILTHFFHLYIIRRRPYYYSVQSDVDPTIWHVERVIPLRERIRKWRGRPRSDSDVFRDEDLERVRRELMTRGWRGRVNSDGTPNRNHRVVDDRAAVGFAAGGVAGMGFGYGYGFGANGRQMGDGEEDVEYGPRQYVESEDTPFWKERRWGHANYGTWGSPEGRRKVFGFGSPVGIRGGNVIPGLSSSRWPTGVVTPEFGSMGKNGPQGRDTGYGLNAAFSYQASPRNTHFITPPIRASSKILEGLNHTGLRYTTDRSHRFPDEELQDHYRGLCENEDSALKDLEEARNAAAVEHTYGNTEQREPDHAQRVVEKLTELEKKLLHAMKRRSVFAERFAVRDSIVEVERGESSRGQSLSEPPPPYTDIDESGLQFDEDNEPSGSGGRR
ncbi:hypothetical protein ABW19_dt0203257 [Dactylella cylindrospora]|nr:hypothetical protein ABW19_dt0203257 [Dactylella cylindrospora]